MESGTHRKMENLDCVVIGAGWNGLAAAKQFHRTQPGSSIVVLEKELSLGGVWCDSRIYPGLKSNNLWGTFEYPDFPMSSEEFGVRPDEHIPGEVLNRYLKVYADVSGIGGFIRTENTVLSAEHQEKGGWVLVVSSPQRAEAKMYARRLIFATGTRSFPFLPDFAGQDSFGGKIFHTKDLAKNRDALASSKAVTVFGAGKSGYDAVYQYATAGVKVNWVIRASGHGPVWMTPPKVTPLNQWVEQLANRRCLTWFSPCIWGDVDGYSAMRNFYSSTAVGRFVASKFWQSISDDNERINQYNKHPDTAKLKPWIDIFFVSGSLSFLNYKTDFFDLVRSEMVDVHIDNIDHLSPGKVHLADGTEFQSDCFIANTGWKDTSAIKFLPEGIESELNIPHPWDPSGAAPESDLANQPALMKQVDEEIFARLPRLKDQPVWNQDFTHITDQPWIATRDEPPPSSLTPYMLYRFLTPASPRFLRHRDTAFIGLQNNLSTTTTAYITGLWISAFFSGELARDPGQVVGDEEAIKELQYQTVLHNRFGRWRYPTDWGNKSPNFIFDALPYLDMLQQDLGLSPFRKNGRLAEMFVPYSPKDYSNITEEWIQARENEWSSKQDL